MLLFYFHNDYLQSFDYLFENRCIQLKQMAGMALNFDVFIFFLNHLIYPGTFSDQGLFSLVVQLTSR